MELNEKQFISGFNSGYLLAKFEPLILSALLKNIQPINSYVSGILSGQKEYELNQVNSQINELGRFRQKVRNEKERD
ncbi:MAG TPA: hypothetical protein PLS73_06295 [Saprospiraceae bacterium]|nr:hypothetical protein [Saprospiraceae bacterium]